MRDRVARALFVNSGILGHKTVAGLLRETTAYFSRIEASHLDLSHDLSWSDRAVRRLFSMRLAPARGLAANIDLRRWREELNVGLLAARRMHGSSGGADVLRFCISIPRQPPMAACGACAGRRRSCRSIARSSLRGGRPNLQSARPPTCRMLSTTRACSNARRRSSLRRDGPPPISRRGIRHLPGKSTSCRIRCGCASTTPSCTSGSCVGVPIPRVASGCSTWAATFTAKEGPDLLAAWQAGGFAARADLTLVTDWPMGACALPDGARVIRGVASHSSEWVELWRSADLFVMPSRSEAFGVVFQEAAAAGLPVIATQINAVPEIVADGETGLLVPPSDPEALVAAMRTLIDSVGLRHAMGRAAHARISKATPAAYADRLQAVIGGILGTHDLHAA